MIYKKFQVYKDKTLYSADPQTSAELKWTLLHEPEIWLDVDPSAPERYKERNANLLSLMS